MKFTKYLAFILITIVISSCSKAILIGEKKSKEATTEQQEQVKTEVMKLLEEEYKQPFKLEDFSYKYETHWEDNTCQLAICPKVIYGTYTLKIQAIDNEIINTEFYIDDENKESIKDVIDSFKKNQLHRIYCSRFDSYYRDYLNGTVPKGNEKDIAKTKKYCDSRNQTSYKRWDDIFKDK